MDDDVRDALTRGRPLIDITTTGRRSGEPRRLEIVTCPPPRMIDAGATMPL